MSWQVSFVLWFTISMSPDCGDTHTDMHRERETHTHTWQHLIHSMLIEESGQTELISFFKFALAAFSPVTSHISPGRSEFIGVRTRTFVQFLAYVNRETA